MHYLKVARFPISLAYLASLASLLLANAQVEIFEQLGVLLATPAYLVTGAVRVMLGTELRWVAPGLILAATLLADALLFWLFFPGSKSRLGESRGVFR